MIGWGRLLGDLFHHFGPDVLREGLDGMRGLELGAEIGHVGRVGVGSTLDASDGSRLTALEKVLNLLLLGRDGMRFVIAIALQISNLLTRGGARMYNLRMA